MHFSYTFNHLQKKDKILAFLIIPLMLFLIYFLINQYYILQKETAVNKQLKVIKLAIKQLKTKKTNINQLITIKYIEKLALKSNINIQNMRIDKKSFNINIIGTCNNGINFILALEENANIKLLTIEKLTQKDIQIHCIFNILKLNNNKIIISSKNIPNPFIQNKYYNTKNKQMVLSAIIGNNICINDKWYNKNDTINEYKIIKISKLFVELVNIKYHKSIKLWIKKDDN